MTKSGRIMAFAAGGGLLLGVLALTDTVATEIFEVSIVNWPRVQAVEGAVSVEGPIAHSIVVDFEEVVTHVLPEESNRLVDAGVLDARGFTELVLSIAGETNGGNLTSGRAGAVLIPETSLARRALDEEGLFLFPLNVAVEVPAGDPVYIAAPSVKHRLAFPRYRVYFYNTAEKAVRLQLTAHLAN